MQYAGAHRNQSKRIRDRTEQNDQDEDRCDVPDHDPEDLLAPEGMSVDFDFLFEPLKAHAFGHEEADCQRRDRHHHGIGKEIKEIQEGHSDDCDESERAVAEAGESSQDDHDHGHDRGALHTAPLKLVREGGYCALCECDGACQCCEQHQSEEQDADETSEAHAREDLGHCHEHEGRTCLEVLRVAAGESEDRGDDHHARQNSDRRIEELDLAGGVFNTDIFLHV